MKRKDMTAAHTPRPSGRSRVLHLSMQGALARGPKPHETKAENAKPKAQKEGKESEDSHE